MDPREKSMNDIATETPMPAMDATPLTSDELSVVNGGRATPKGRTDVIKVMAATTWEPTTGHR
jgi:hypothetical protein